eukprot:324876-Rhodomonas_salina.2
MLASGVPLKHATAYPLSSDLPALLLDLRGQACASTLSLLGLASGRYLEFILSKGKTSHRSGSGSGSKTARGRMQGAELPPGSTSCFSTAAARCPALTRRCAPRRLLRVRNR